MPKFQEEVMEPLEVRAHAKKNKAVPLPKHSSSQMLDYIFLKLWQYKIQTKLLPLMTFSGGCNRAFSHS